MATLRKHAYSNTCAFQAHLANKEANSRHTYDVTIWLSWTTDDSNIFIRSREVRDNESRLYIENFTSKNWKFSDKNLWYFFICLLQT